MEKEKGIMYTEFSKISRGRRQGMEMRVGREVEKRCV